MHDRCSDSADRITHRIAYTVLYLCVRVVIGVLLHDLLTVVHNFISGVVFHPLLKVNSERDLKAHMFT